ncbi:MAG TPA: tetratricopeptide repeat protein, partial [Nitrospira sp.]
ANRSFVTGYLLQTIAMALHEDADLLRLAVRHYCVAAELRQDAVGIVRNLGLAYASLEQWDKAVQAYSKALALAPDDPELLTDAAAAQQRAGRAEEAAALYYAALRLSPNSSRRHIDLGILLWNMGQLEEATVEFRQALVIDPTSAVATYNLGLALESKGLRKETIAMWESFLDSPDSATEKENVRSKMREAISRLKSAIPVESGSLSFDSTK